VKRINSSDADVVNLHWVQREMLSIADISRIKKPVVWTLHDMWAFCGAEHYSFNNRWREGYLANNRPEDESGLDLNRWAFERKTKHWKSPLQIVTPSNWLATCVSESALMSKWPVTAIPNPIDVASWQPAPRDVARTMFGLPKGARLILFGAIGGTKDNLKGFDLLQDALYQLRNDGESSEVELVVFGELEPRDSPDMGFTVHYVGHLHDDVSLALLYSAVDVMVVPSRVEAFGQTASEANACGTPVVAFDTSGLRDIVVHKKNGYLARCFDVGDLAAGTLWVLQKVDSSGTDFRAEVRKSAVQRFSYQVVGEKYREILSRTLDSEQNCAE